MLQKMSILTQVYPDLFFKPAPGLFTCLHGDQQCLAVLVAALCSLLKLTPLGRRKQSTFTAVCQEVSKVGIQVIQGLLSVRRGLEAHLNQQKHLRIRDILPTGQHVE